MLAGAAASPPRRRADRRARRPAPGARRGLLRAAGCCALLAAAAASDDPCRKSQLPWDLDLISLVEHVDYRRIHLAGEYLLRQSGEERFNATLGMVEHWMRLRLEEPAELRVALAPSQVADVGIVLWRETGAGRVRVANSTRGGGASERAIFAELSAQESYRLQFFYSLRMDASGQPPECPTVLLELAVQLVRHQRAALPCPDLTQEPMDKDGRALDLHLDQAADGTVKFETPDGDQAPRILLQAHQQADLAPQLVGRGPYKIVLPHTAGRRGEFALRVTARADFIEGGDIGVLVTPDNYETDTETRLIGTLPTPEECEAKRFPCLYGIRGRWKNFLMLQSILSDEVRVSNSQSSRGVRSQSGQYLLWLFQRREYMPKRDCTPYHLSVSLGPVHEPEDFLNCGALPLPQTLNAPGFYDPQSGALHFYQGVLLGRADRSSNVSFTPVQDTLLRATVQHTTADVDISLNREEQALSGGIMLTPIAVSDKYYGPEGIVYVLKASTTYRLVFSNPGLMIEDPEAHERGKDWMYFCETFGVLIEGVQTADRRFPIAPPIDVHPQGVDAMPARLLVQPHSFIFTGDFNEGDLPFAFHPHCCRQETIRSWDFEVVVETVLQLTLRRSYVSDDVVAEIWRVRGNQTDQGETIYSRPSPEAATLDATLVPGKYSLKLKTSYIQSGRWELSNESATKGEMPRELRYNLDLRMQPANLIGAPITNSNVSCTDACVRHDEAQNSPAASRCRGDCDCDGNRTCSTSGWCGGDSGHCAIDDSDLRLCPGARPLPKQFATNTEEPHVHLLERFVVPSTATRNVSFETHNTAVLHLHVTRTDVQAVVVLMRRDVLGGWVRVTNSSAQDLYNRGTPWLMARVAPRRKHQLQFQFEGKSSACDSFELQLAVSPASSASDELDLCTAEMQRLPPADLFKPEPLALPFHFGPETFVYRGQGTMPHRHINLTLDRPAELKALVRFDFRFQHLYLDICKCEGGDFSGCWKCGDWRGEPMYNGEVIQTKPLMKGSYILKVYEADVVRNAPRSGCVSFSLQVWVESPGRASAPPLESGVCMHEFLPRSLNGVGLLQDNNLHILGDVRMDMTAQTDYTNFNITQRSVVRVWVPEEMDRTDVSVAVSLTLQNGSAFDAFVTEGTALYEVLEPGAYRLDFTYMLGYAVNADTGVMQINDAPLCAKTRVEIAVLPVTGTGLDHLSAQCTPNPAFPREPLSHGHTLRQRPIPDNSEHRFLHKLNFSVGSKGGVVEFDLRSAFETGGLTLELTGRTTDMLRTVHFRPERYLHRDYLAAAVPGGFYELTVRDMAMRSSNVKVGQYVKCNHYSLHMTFEDRGNITVPTAPPPTSSPVPPREGTAFPTHFPTHSHASCENPELDNFNSCQYANDGVCDDGGPYSQYYACTIGFDCADCGFRDFRNESSPLYAYREWHWNDTNTSDQVGDDNGGGGDSFYPPGWHDGRTPETPAPVPAPPSLQCVGDDKQLSEVSGVQNDSTGYIFFYDEGITFPVSKQEDDFLFGMSGENLYLTFTALAPSLVRVWSHTHSGADVDLMVLDETDTVLDSAISSDHHTESLGVQVPAGKYRVEVSFYDLPHAEYNIDYTTCDDKLRLTTFDLALIVVPDARVRLLERCGADWMPGSQSRLPKNAITLSRGGYIEDGDFAFNWEDKLAHSDQGQEVDSLGLYSGAGPDSVHHILVDIPPATQDPTIQVQIRFNFALADILVVITAPNQTLPIAVFDADADRNAERDYNAVIDASLSALTPQMYTVRIELMENSPELLAGEHYCIPFHYSVSVTARSYQPAVTSVEPLSMTDLVPTQKLFVKVALDSEAHFVNDETAEQARPLWLKYTPAAGGESMRLYPQSVGLINSGGKSTIQAMFADNSGENEGGGELQWGVTYELSLDASVLKDSSGKVFALGPVARLMPIKYTTVSGRCVGGFCATGGQCPFVAPGDYCDRCSPDAEFVDNKVCRPRHTPAPTPEPTSDMTGPTPLPWTLPPPEPPQTPQPATPKPWQPPATPAPHPWQQPTPQPTPEPPQWTPNPVPVVVPTPVPTPEQEDCSKPPYCGLGIQGDGSDSGGSAGAVASAVVLLVLAAVLGVACYFCGMPYMRRRGWLGGASYRNPYAATVQLGEAEELDEGPGARAEV
eukprot:TRINITY_DN9489_c0_g3_i1.p1 TRINITY_DN9489_c0_g3~~TRINITY_DN9489_c0_g3_i1.p1  ORF type:complete len:2176 (+),score=666.32 TRINITY_DN9489_c0_g3_i1:116-6529(+)